MPSLQAWESALSISWQPIFLYSTARTKVASIIQGLSNHRQPTLPISQRCAATVTPKSTQHRVSTISRPLRNNQHHVRKLCCAWPAEVPASLHGVLHRYDFGRTSSSACSSLFEIGPSTSSVVLTEVYRDFAKKVARTARTSSISRAPPTKSRAARPRYSRD